MSINKRNKTIILDNKSNIKNENTLNEIIN